MPLDPQAKAFLDQTLSAGLPPLEAMTVPEAREALLNLAALQGPPEEVAAVGDRVLPGPAGDIPVRIYTPEGSGPFPVLVYFHGGGWVLGNLETVDGVCRGLANGAGCVVVSVDYRLAPEHKFPAAADDCYAATQWVAENAASIKADPARLAIAGDSAGGNLTAVVSLIARDRGGPRLAYQLLIYPATDASCGLPSQCENGKDYLLTHEAMVWFWGHYLRDDADRRNPYASPLRAENLSGLPPAFVITAEFDPLRDEGEAYAQRLRDAGVPAELRRYDGMIHGFFGMSLIFDQARNAVNDASAALRRAFGAA